MRKLILPAALALGAALSLSLSPAQARAGNATSGTAGDVARGTTLYQQRCAVCHSLDANRVGPLHRGVFGRKAGAVSGYTYSTALKKLNVVWNARTLDTWLANPSAMAPGTAMGVRVPVAQDRADLIAYLRSVSPPVSAAKKK